MGEGSADESLASLRVIVRSATEFFDGLERLVGGCDGVVVCVPDAFRRVGVVGGDVFPLVCVPAHLSVGVVLRAVVGHIVGRKLGDQYG